jgi:hypothetical protein
MPIPTLNKHGYLPPGAHHCTLEEVEATFNANEHRRKLISDLKRFLDWLKTAHRLNLPYYIDGSFTTGKEFPSDIDVVLDGSNATAEEIVRTLLLVTKRPEIKAQFRIDFLPYFPGCPHDLRDFFQYIRTDELNNKRLPPQTRKGILRILP